MSFDPETLIPDEALKIFGFHLMAYYDSQGTMTYKIHVDQNGDVPISTLIGMLDMAKFEIINHATAFGNALLDEEGDD